MNWEALGAIGQLLGSVLVLVSLLYIAAQIRQNTTAVRAGTFQSVIALATTYGDEVAKNPELRRVMRAGLAADTETEIDPNAFHFILLSFLRRYENMHYQSYLGLLPDAQWQGLRASLARYVGQPGFQSWWQGNAVLFNTDFREFIGEMSKSAGAVGSHFS
jgi:hypothetical protein